MQSNKRLKVVSSVIVFKDLTEAMSESLSNISEDSRVTSKILENWEGPTES